MLKTTILTIIILTFSVSYGQAGKDSSELSFSEADLVNLKFTKINKVSGVPKNIINKLKELTNFSDNTVFMVNPGEEF